MPRLLWKRILKSWVLFTKNDSKFLFCLLFSAVRVVPLMSRHSWNARKRKSFLLSSQIRRGKNFPTQSRKCIKMLVLSKKVCHLFPLSWKELMILFLKRIDTVSFHNPINENCNLVVQIWKSAGSNLLNILQVLSKTVTVIATIFSVICMFFLFLFIPEISDQSFNF